MKVKVFLNRIKIPYQDDFNKAKEYFLKHGVDVEFEFTQINITGYKVEQENFGSVGMRLQITGHENQLTLSNDYISIFAFDGNEFPLSKLPTSKAKRLPNGVLVTLMTYKEGDATRETYLTLIHELMHAFNLLLASKGVNLEDPMDIMFRNGKWLQYYKNDQPDALDSNFGEAWKILTPNLSKLKGYKYFSSAEVAKWKLKPELWRLLDKMREIANTPFVITSGFRTTQENINAAGKPNSAHLRGLAVDLLCTDNFKRSKMLKGITNFQDQIFLEQAKKHLHIDVDASIHALGQTIVEEDD